MTVKVKICGITRLDDSIAAADAGADYLGFILYPPSPRYVEPADLQVIIRELRSRGECPLLVGVFVNEEAAAMAEVMASCDLDLAQLSGDESPQLLNDPSSPIFGRGYKGMQPRSSDTAKKTAELYLPPDTSGINPQLLVDAYHDSLRGGTGERGDWRIAAALARFVPKLMLAGGLNPTNVEEAIAAVDPYAVDVSSGVEYSPGRKDTDKIHSFIEAVHMASKSDR